MHPQLRFQRDIENGKKLFIVGNTGNTILFSGVKMSGSKCERPITRYQPPDWHARNAKLANHAISTREESLNLRKEAQLLRIETDARTKWNNYENNMRLSERY